MISYGTKLGAANNPEQSMQHKVSGAQPYDLKSETTGFHDGSTRINVFLPVRCVAKGFLSNLLAFGVHSIALWVLKHDRFENFPFLVTQ